MVFHRACSYARAAAHAAFLINESYKLGHGRRLPLSKYLSGVEDKFKGPGKAKMKFYADQLIDTYYKAEGIVKKNNVAGFDLAKLRIAYSPLPTRDHAFPTPHLEATGFPFYVRHGVCAMW